MRKPVISIILVAILITVSLSGCLRGGVVTGSGNMVTEEMNFSDFTRVEAGYAFEVEITQSGSYSISITADDNLFDFIQVSKTGKTLKIRLQSGYDYQSVTTRAKITTPELRGLGLSGATQGTVIGFSSTEDFKLDLSGASSLDMSDMSAGDIKFGLSGASSVTGVITASGDAQFNLSGASAAELKGSANDMLIDASGASHLELADFPVCNADVGLSGSSGSTINLDGRLGADLSGASYLRYIGEPTMGDIETSGGSVMEKIEPPPRKTSGG